MELIQNNPKITDLSNISLNSALNLKKESVWQQLGEIKVEDVIFNWLETFGSNTQRSYGYGVKKLVDLGLMDLQHSLQEFALINHNVILDRIKLVQEWSETTCQARAACYLSFTRFLSRRTEGVIKRAEPSKEGANKTFYKVREKVSTKAIDMAQWMRFLEVLEKYNYRDSLIAKAMLQGGKRISEVLSLQSFQIDFDEQQVIFIQSKTKGIHKELAIHYPTDYMRALKEYLQDREGVVFVTKNGQKLKPTQIERSFAKAGEKAKIPFKVTPHVIRASVVTYLKGQGFSDSDVMKVTGHASSEMVNAYDKSQQADNITKKINLI